jgi:hypothetical protein
MTSLGPLSRLVLQAANAAGTTTSAASSAVATTAAAAAAASTSTTRRCLHTYTEHQHHHQQQQQNHQQEQQQQPPHHHQRQRRHFASSSSAAAAAAAAAAPPASQPSPTDPLAAAVLSEDGAARLCSPRSADVLAALPRVPALRQLQRHFSVSQPGLRGQAVLARVVRSSAGAVIVDPGYYGLSAVATEDLGALQLYSAAGAPLPAGDAAAGARLRRGSYLRLRLGRLFTPYGDVQLDPLRVRPEVRRKLVWGELRERMSRGSPVWGRVLNPCAGGYAVGVAGYVALLPSQQASIHNIQAIGTLQQFYIHRMDERARRIELSNYADSGAGGGGGGGIGGGGGGPGGAADGGGADASLWSNI